MQVNLINDDRSRKFQCLFSYLRCNTTTQAVAVTGIGVDTDILSHGNPSRYQNNHSP